MLWMISTLLSEKSFAFEIVNGLGQTATIKVIISTQNQKKPIWSQMSTVKAGETKKFNVIGTDLKNIQYLLKHGTIFDNISLSAYTVQMHNAIKVCPNITILHNEGELNTFLSKGPFTITSQGCTRN